MSYKLELESLFKKSLESVDPYSLIKSRCHLTNDELNLLDHTGKDSHISLNNFDRIILLGIGKAASSMTLAMEELLGKRISDSLVITKKNHTIQGLKSPYIEAGHPIPNENSLVASQRVRALLEGTCETDLVIVLLSGGASALLTSPFCNEDITLSLSDIMDTTQKLLDCGAPIEEINQIRKHLSNVKGGRLMEMLFPASCLTLTLSDVISNDLSIIGSGITVPDPSTYKDCLSILEKYDLPLGANVMSLFIKGAEGLFPETPKFNHQCFEKVTNILIGTNYTLLTEVKEQAEQRGFSVLSLTSHLKGEAREIANVFHSIAKSIRAYSIPHPSPVVLIAGGESTVTIKGQGVGGRNQEMALAFLNALKDDYIEDVYFLSGASDGTDGPTEDAGGIVCSKDLEDVIYQKLDLYKYLRDNNSNKALELLESLLHTGPTLTNVCDIQICLVV
ncbi:glycerate kinase type-2 family protein [Spirochaeta cellobiosiphila]|uniref:glycerate kinase type-2 family protein n=1 Tax=Spirochaeta cellobiosiphila TaxID=504483 RepID=UPI0004184472|nr:glycerate kinase [Spirochaeta cellobiosiphila]